MATEAASASANDQGTDDKINDAAFDELFAGAEEEKYPPCYICHDTSEYPFRMMLPCNKNIALCHLFCHNCIASWWISSNQENEQTCPACHAKVDPERAAIRSYDPEKTVKEMSTTVEEINRDYYKCDNCNIKMRREKSKGTLSQYDKCPICDGPVTHVVTPDAVTDMEIETAIANSIE